MNTFSTLRLVVALSFTAPLLHAQDLHLPPKGIPFAMENKPPQPTVTYIEKLDEQQKAFYWRNTIRHPDGYLEMSDDDAYFRMPENFLKRKNAHTIEAGSHFAKELKGRHLGEVTYLGEFIENKLRTNLFFRTNENRLIMLTLWDMERDGGKTIIIKEFLNVSVNGARGTLTLSKSLKDKEALWKMGWLQDGRDHEFYLQDQLNDMGKPSKTPAQVIELAGRLTKTTR